MERSNKPLKRPKNYSDNINIIKWPNNKDWLNYNFDDYYNCNKEKFNNHNYSFDELYQFYILSKYKPCGFMHNYKYEQNCLYKNFQYSKEPDMFIEKLKIMFNKIISIQITSNKNFVKIHAHTIENYDEFSMVCNFYKYNIFNMDWLPNDEKLYTLKSKYDNIEASNYVYEKLNGIVYCIVENQNIDYIKRNGICNKDNLFYMYGNYDKRLFKRLSNKRQYKNPVILKLDLSKNWFTLKLFKNNIYKIKDGLLVMQLLTLETIHPQCIIDIIDLKNGNQK
jgi:hypothetical protein